MIGQTSETPYSFSSESSSQDSLHDGSSCDDEALLTEPQPPAFKFAYFLYPVHGIALVAGSSKTGRTIASKLTLRNVRNLVKFLGNIQTEPIINVLSWD